MNLCLLLLLAGWIVIPSPSVLVEMRVLKDSLYSQCSLQSAQHLLQTVSIICLTAITLPLWRQWQSLHRFHCRLQFTIRIKPKKTEANRAKNVSNAWIQLPIQYLNYHHTFGSILIFVRLLMLSRLLHNISGVETWSYLYGSIKQFRGNWVVCGI